jgi:hypothetical protein
MHQEQAEITITFTREEAQALFDHLDGYNMSAEIYLSLLRKFISRGLYNGR